MEVPRIHRAALIQDLENVNVVRGSRGKQALSLPKKNGAYTRALGEINANVQVQREINVGKVAVATAEFEKKARLGSAKRYNHVQSKINTGLTGKPPINVQPTARPPLRREENTEAHTAKALRATRATFVKESTKTTIKEPSFTIKKESKKNNEIKENKNKVCTKATLKDPAESLGKLKIGEKQSIINVNKLKETSEECSDLSVEFPADIEDIDAGDCDPLLMTMYIKDIYRYLMELELKYPIEPDHLKNQSIVTPRMRSELLDWLVEVHQQFELLLETFHLTVGIIDRYLQVAPNVPRNQLQLIGVTALFIACKYEETYIPGIEEFVYITVSAYTEKEVIRCEQEIMTKLSFCLARPIPLNFLRRFIKAAHGNSKQRHLAKYFVDLCLIDYSMSHYRPSLLSAAAICLSVYLLSNQDMEEIWTPSMEYYTSYTFGDIKPIVVQIAKIVINVENSKYKAVYNKYQDAMLAKVSTLAQLKSERLYVIADTNIDSEQLSLP